MASTESRPGPRFGNDSTGTPDGVLRVGGAVTKPVLIRDGIPRYAKSLERAVTIRGPVVIEAIIDKDGRISDARYLKGGDQPGAAAALEAVRGRHYRPAMLAGKPVAVYMVTTINIHYQ